MLYQIELLTYLTGFLMHRVFVAEATIFFVFDTARLIPPIFGRGIIAPATDFALQRYLVSWHRNSPRLVGSFKENGADDQG